jgi:hypothetical protein
MSEPYEVLAEPELERPVLVVMLQGWIDAGVSAATAVGTLDKQLDTAEILRFDGDTFLDYRARRPLMELREGVNTGLVWPRIVLKHGKDRDGKDVLLLTGHEPDMAWLRFCDLVGSLAERYGVRLALGLGAYPFGSPHTRPSRVSITAGSEELAASLPYLRNSVDVPAGIEAALEVRFTELGIPAVGLWAQVPHYAANFPYPGATLSLLAALCDVAEVSLDLNRAMREADAHRVKLDELVRGSEEHLAMLRQMEEAYDAEAASGASPAPGSGPVPDGPLPTGDEIAAELERYLRDQGSP